MSSTALVIVCFVFYTEGVVLSRHGAMWAQQVALSFTSGIFKMTAFDQPSSCVNICCNFRPFGMQKSLPCMKSLGRDWARMKWLFCSIVPSEWAGRFSMNTVCVC